MSNENTSGFVWQSALAQSGHLFEEPLVKSHGPICKQDFHDLADCGRDQGDLSVVSRSIDADAGIVRLKELLDCPAGGSSPDGCVVLS
jgi:hypothetical protein